MARAAENSTEPLAVVRVCKSISWWKDLFSFVRTSPESAHLSSHYRPLVCPQILQTLLSVSGKREIVHVHPLLGVVAGGLAVFIFLSLCFILPAHPPPLEWIWGCKSSPQGHDTRGCEFLLRIWTLNKIGQTERDSSLVWCSFLHLALSFSRSLSLPRFLSVSRITKRMGINKQAVSISISHPRRDTRGPRDRREGRGQVRSISLRLSKLQI